MSELISLNSDELMTKFVLENGKMKFLLAHAPSIVWKIVVSQYGFLLLTYARFDGDCVDKIEKIT